MTVTRRQFISTAALALGAVGLGGCTFPTPSPPRVTPMASPAQASSDLPVGVILSLTGRYSREGALLRAGYEVWADAVTAASGIKQGVGRKSVRLVYADDESEPLNAARQAERLAANERIRLWLGPFTSAITTTVAMAADRLGAVVVAPDASAGAMYRRGLKGIISILGSDDRLFHGLADLAATAEPRAEPVGLLIADEPSTVAAAGGLQERAAALGLAPVRLEMAGLGSTNISAPLERIAELAPRCVVVATEAGQTARFASTIRELLPFTPMRALIPLPAPVRRADRRSVIFDGALTVESWWPSITASGPVLGSAREFAERFRRLHGYETEPRCAAAAAAGLALQLAIERADSTEPAAVREAFSVLDVMTFWGRMAWDTAGRNRAALAPVLQQQGDALVAVYPGELAGGRFHYPLAGWPAD